VDRIVQIGPIPPTYDFFVQSASTPLDKENMAQLTKLQEEGVAESDPERFCTEFWNIYMKRIFFDPSKIGLMRSDKCKCAPVLTIHGDSDTLPLKGSRVWVSSLGNARLLVVQEAGHLPFVEQPEVFYPAVDTFLKGEWPAGAEVVSAPIE